jgi:N-methylhydantoinase B
MVEEWPSKSSGRKLFKSDVIRVTGPNAGGYGDPMRRAPTLVLADWLDGIISLDEARDIYGVIIDATRQSVDEAATRGRRG